MSFITDLAKSEKQQKVQKPIALNCTALIEVEAREIEWLWNQRIPKGTVTIIEGDGGRGKSTVIADLCARLSTGSPLPGDPQRPVKRILLLAAEDDPGCVLRPRFEKHDADLTNVFFDDQTILLNEDGIKALEFSIEEKKFDLVVIDPIVAFLGQKIDMNKGNDVRSALTPLREIGRRTGCTFVIVRHFNKSRDGSASQKGAGSVDFRNFARSVLQVIFVNEETFLALEKSNYAAKAPTLKFGIVNGRVSWNGQSELTADQLHAESNSCGEGMSALSEAEGFLRSELQNGAKEVKEILRLAKDCGISERTLNRAKAKIGVVSDRLGAGWGWHFTKPGSVSNQVGQECQTAEVQRGGHHGNLERLENLHEQMEVRI